MLRLLADLLASLLFLSTAHAQMQQCSWYGPSLPFGRTHYLAAPPVDLNQPPIYLPESIPISEEPQESQAPAGRRIWITRRTRVAKR
ncbi:PREDICTED: uncharacterized protein LOC108360701 [Rhagoletis zephyria]|uniref:uncharacterized protein LOC108360701 n=1 Tax=Rhagoletis zephyria TaxID=28612 RepID=UPI0008117351|nr:PREDICTED: uncharacterized protein LOC108360701 [Rhagoletis zephyria]